MLVILIIWLGLNYVVHVGILIVLSRVTVTNLTMCGVVSEEPLHLVKGVQVNDEIYNDLKTAKVKRKYNSSDSRDHAIDQGNHGNQSVGQG